jgi:hypothetical protein
MNHHMAARCPDCGGPRDDRAKRCRGCADKARRGAPRLATGWAEARRLYPLDGVLCENHCGNPAVDHHHIDGDPHNNAPENVLRVCRRCHMRLDGRVRSRHQRARGAATGKAKLTEDDVRAIRCRRQSESLAVLAAEYGISQSLVSQITRRKLWAHVA